MYGCPYICGVFFSRTFAASSGNDDLKHTVGCSIVEDLVLVTDDHVEDRIEPVGRQLVIKIGDKTMKLRTSEFRGKRIIDHGFAFAYRACANSDRFVEEKGLAKKEERAVSPGSQFRKGSNEQ